MPDDAFDALRAQLGGTAPDALRRLSAAELTHLSQAIRGARRRESKALAQAGERKGADYVVVASDGARTGTAFRCASPSVTSPR